MITWAIALSSSSPRVEGAAGGDCSGPLVVGDRDEDADAVTAGFDEGPMLLGEEVGVAVGASHSIPHEHGQ